MRDMRICTRNVKNLNQQICLGNVGDRAVIVQFRCRCVTWTGNTGNWYRLLVQMLSVYKVATWKSKIKSGGIILRWVLGKLIVSVEIK